MHIVLDGNDANCGHTALRSRAVVLIVFATEVVKVLMNDVAALVMASAMIEIDGLDIGTVEMEMACARAAQRARIAKPRSGNGTLRLGAHPPPASTGAIYRDAACGAVRKRRRPP